MDIRISRAMRTICAIGAATLVGAGASGAMITLSTHSSDETPPNVLDASMDFSVVGDQLTLTLTNTTAWPADYEITAIYFNGTSNVTGLSMNAPVAGWSFSTAETADGFGLFDFALIDGMGAELLPGDSQVFSFTISGTATDIDFTTDFATTPPGDTPAIAVAKFQSGPGDDSAFGAYIPTPGVASVMLMGLAAGARRRR
ncbi:MAG: hypothetical protein ACYTF7_09165 [Planctomycetota bacterium]|jgi:hypothetical protein